ncbi:MAG TPA: FAD-dependent oxidoreductase [Gemmatimonadaceae bacterium]|nr:FAD-dependent oxidoreductase [Gemmatimonadaceae bacterium]
MDLTAAPATRDVAEGIPSAELPDGSMLEGALDGERVLLARAGGVPYAIGAQCSHYGASLANGLLVDDTVRCPLHHACFSLRTGDALCGPAFTPVASYEVTESDGVVRVGARRAATTRRPGSVGAQHRVGTIAILGAGAAGAAAADMLRRRGYDGRVVMLSAEHELPYDRPNLSKDFLAGTAPEDWLPLRPREYYDDANIELMLGHRVSGIDSAARELKTLSGGRVSYDRLLIATGAEAVRLPVATHRLRHVFTLRSTADARAIIAASHSARRAVVVGASFVGLEAAASLRARGIEVDVVAQGRTPLEPVFGPELSAFVRGLHESRGVRFHVNETVRAIDESHVTLSGGGRLEAQLVVVGIGVRPSVAVAQWAKLDVGDGVNVDEFLETSRPGIFAAGDIACWPERVTGSRARMEHWNVAVRQGQIAACNMLGERIPFTAVPYFWSQHYDVTIQYTGLQGGWDQATMHGNPADRDCAVEYRRAGALVGVATIGRDMANLRAELAFERGETGMVQSS